MRSLTIAPPPFNVRIEGFHLEESALQTGPQRLQAAERDLFAGRIRLVARHLPLVECIEKENVRVLFGRACECVGLTKAGLRLSGLARTEMRLTQVAPGLCFQTAKTRGM